MKTYQAEAWAAFREDVRVLLPQHWEEIALDRAKVPLDVDWPRYDALAAAGALHCVTAREDGRLIGYHVAIVSGHLHYASTLHGFTDVYFLLPEARAGRTGLRLFQEVERQMRALGVKKLFTGTKLHLDQSRLLEHLGYRRTEYLYTKLIGE